MPRIVLCGHWDYNPDCFERADKQALINETLSLISFKTGEQVLIHHPCNEADGPNPKLISPWRGPHTVRAQMSPVANLDALDDFFPGPRFPCPILKAPCKKL